MAQGFGHAVSERLVERHRQANVAEEGIARHLLTFAWPAGGNPVVGLGNPAIWAIGRAQPASPV